MPHPEIEKAVQAHQQWKVRLKTAIATRRVDAPLAVIAAQDRCDLGRWLHGSDVPPALRSSAGYAEVARLHAEFHRAAASVAELAQKGDAPAAEKALAAGGAFTAASHALLDALRAWGAGRG